MIWKAARLVALICIGAAIFVFGGSTVSAVTYKVKRGPNPSPETGYLSTGSSGIAGNRITTTSILADVGDHWVCNGTASNTDDPCDEDADCLGGGTCVKAGQDGSTAMDSSNIVSGFFATAGPAPGSGSWWHQDNLFVEWCYNMGESCELLGADSSDTHAVRHIVELDYTPNASEDSIVEDYLEVFPATTPSEVVSWRPMFRGINATDEVFSLNLPAGIRKDDDGNRKLVNLARWGYAQPNAVTDDAGLGSISLPNLGFSIGAEDSKPSSSLGIVTNTHYQDNAAVSITQYQTLPTASAYPPLKINLNMVAGNPYGGCDGGGAQPDGTKCIINDDCGTGGICVKGDGVAGSGSKDGICNGGADDGKLCTTIGAGLCAGGNDCVDIQQYHAMTLTAPRGIWVRTLFDDAVSADGYNIMGYCSSVGGSPEDEGKYCWENDDCDSGSCVVENDGRDITDVVGAYIDQVVANTGARGIKTSPAKHIQNMIGIDIVKTLSSSANQAIQTIAGIKIETPTLGAFSAAGNSLAYNTPIWIANQVDTTAGDAPSPWLIYTATQSVDPDTPGGTHLIAADSFGWDTGNFKLGNIRLWDENEGTGATGVNSLRMKYGADPTTGAGGAVDGVRVRGLRSNFVICGEATTVNNNTVYYGPDRTLTATSSTGLGCDIDAVGNAGAAGPVDDDVFESDAFHVLGMVCRNEADANADITFTLYDDTAVTVPSVTCTIADNKRECVADIQTTTQIAANSQMAIAASSTGDIADNNGFVCNIEVSLGD